MWIRKWNARFSSWAKSSITDSGARKTSCRVRVAFLKVQLIRAVPGVPNLSDLWHHINSICRDGTCLHNLNSFVSHPNICKVWFILSCPYQRRSSGPTPFLSPLVLQWEAWAASLDSMGMYHQTVIPWLLHCCLDGTLILSWLCVQQKIQY